MSETNVSRRGLVPWSGRRRVAESDVFDLLSNRRRRETLRYLGGRPGGVSIRDLSEAVATAESGEAPAPRDLRDSVYVSLHQNHLPRLDEHGVVDYDAEEKEVRMVGGIHEVDPYMNAVSPYGVSWGECYRTLGVVGLAAVAAAAAGVPVVAAIPPLVWATAFLVMFVGSSALHLWPKRWLVVHHLRRLGRSGTAD